MHLLHTSRDGDRMFIGQMAEKHLRNTINLWLDKAEQGLTIGTSQARLTNRQAAVLGIDIERIQEDCRDNIPSILSSAYPYIVEAVLRWTAEPDHAEYMTHLRDRLRGIMDRTGKMEPLGLTSALPDHLEVHLLESPSRKRQRKRWS